MMTTIAKKILILKTSLASRSDVKKISLLFNDYPEITDWNVDLEDCDKILRIECYDLNEADIKMILQHEGIEAEELQ